MGLLLTVSAATIVLGQPLLSTSPAGRLDDPTALAIGHVVLAAGLLLTGLATSLAAYVVATVVWSVGDLVLLGRVYTLVSAIAPEHARGAYLAAFGTSWGFAAVVAPLLGTQLLAATGPTVTWSAWPARASPSRRRTFALVDPSAVAVPRGADRVVGTASSSATPSSGSTRTAR